MSSPTSTPAAHTHTDSETSQDVLFFSSDDWGWKTSKYHISTRLAKQGKLLFISSIGFRAPKKSTEDMGRIWRKLKSFTQGTREVAPNLHVLTPIVIPFAGVPAKDRLNRMLLKLQIAYAMRKLAMKKPLMFVFSQNWVPYISDIERTKCIYYVVDDQSAFKGLDAEQFKAWDKQLCETADGIFCTSRTLYEQKRQLNPRTIAMPHGVDYDNFKQAWAQGTPCAHAMNGLSRPRMLFFGHLSYDWVDVELLKACAKLRPDWSWVLVGRNSTESAEFAEHTNIIYLGEQEFTKLPQYCKAADVGIIPFVDTELTKNCNPLKLPEYVAAGLPVVSTPIPAVVELYPLDARVASTPAAFVQACEEALTDTQEHLKSRSEAMAAHSWDQRLTSILQHIKRF